MNQTIEVLPELAPEPKKYAARPRETGRVIEMVDSVSVVQFQGPTSIILWRGPAWPHRRTGKRRQRTFGADFVTPSVIQKDGPGKARLTGTRIKVSLVAEEHTRLGMTPEQIAREHPHLTLAQVHAALAYYYSHQEGVEAQIAESLAFADQSRQQAGPSPLATRLRAQGRLLAERAA